MGQVSNAGGGGGSSYISGHTGCASLVSKATIGPVNGIDVLSVSIDAAKTKHFSNVEFSATNMIEGGNTGNGYVVITKQTASN